MIGEIRNRTINKIEIKINEPLMTLKEFKQFVLLLKEIQLLTNFDFELKTLKTI